jgi:hypothetical protein
MRRNLRRVARLRSLLRPGDGTHRALIHQNDGPSAKTARSVSSSGAGPIILKEQDDAAGEGAPAADGVRAARSAGDLFGILWRELADVLGTAAAASLVRRAAQRAASRFPELAALAITRESLEYRYTVPAIWNDPSRDPPQALRELARELWTLLVELTGTVVVNRLASVPELRDRGLVPTQEEQS